MCRHLAYLGPPVTAAELVLDPPHSLSEQSYTPCDMRGGGTVNADGFGLAWYAGGQVRRYRRSVPIWADESLPDLARSIESTAILAAVRNGTTGMAHTEATVAPFTDGGWAFSHNGVIAGWPDSVGKLAERLPGTDLLTLDAPTDSALLWALIRHRLRTGSSAIDAVRTTLTEVVAAAPESRLNVLLTDGTQIVASAWWHSLAVRRTGDSVLIASEPSDPDDPSWQQVPDRRLLLATGRTLELTELEGPL